MISLLKLSPIVIFAAIVIFAGYDILIAGLICTFIAIFIAMITTKKGFSAIFDIGLESTKKSTVVFFIIMFAYAVAEIFLATGVGASIISIALDLGISAKSVAVSGFLLTCLLSVATGTSWGTFAACAPVFLWLNYIVDGNLILTLGSIVGGCCFGDNIGLISETTILSSGLQEVKVTDRIRHQGIWSISCLVITTLIIFVISMGMSGVPGDVNEAISSISPESWDLLQSERPSAVLLLNQVQDGVPKYMCIPIFIVIGLAVKGVSTMACLGSGILSAMVLGLFAGTIPDLNTFFNVYMLDGLASAGGWAVILIMWVTAFGGIMTSMNAFEPLSAIMVKMSKKVRHLMTWNAILCLLANAAFADEVSEIAATGPILRNITEENVEGSDEDMYKLRLRNATFADALGVYGAQFIPWHACVVFYLSIANAVFPLHTFVAVEIIQMNFMAMIAVVSMLVLTITGLDRFVPLFRIPSEPKVHLKKHTKKQ